MELPNVTGCGDNIPRPGYSFTYRNEKHEIIYFPKGASTIFKRNGRRYLLEQPCVTITRAGDEYSFTFDSEEPTRHMYVNFEYNPDASQASLCPIFRIGGESVVHVPEGTIVEGLFMHILCLAGMTPKSSRERRNRTLYLLLSEIETLAASKVDDAVPELPVNLQRIVEYIETRVTSPLTVSALVRESQWSYGYFYREFVRHIGVSPKEYICIRRIELACRLLIERNDTIKMISAHAGFDDPHYFSRLFSRIKGVTPTQYRRNHSDVRVRSLGLVNSGNRLYPLNSFIVLE